MKNNCIRYLTQQIDLIQPRYIITLGDKAFQAIIREWNVPSINGIKIKEIPPLTECIKRGLSYEVNSFLIIPEQHPSKQCNINKKSRELYPELKSRLKEKLLRIFRD